MYPPAQLQFILSIGFDISATANIFLCLDNKFCISFVLFKATKVRR